MNHQFLLLHLFQSTNDNIVNEKFNTEYQIMRNSQQKISKIDGVKIDGVRLD